MKNVKRSTVTCFMLILAVSIVFAEVVVQAGADFLKVGYSKIDITPPLGIELCGYTSNGARTALGVNDPLYAYVIYFENDTGRAMIVNTDLIGFDLPYAEALKEEIMKQTGLKRDQVMILSTHTHSGPVSTHLGVHKIMDYDYMDVLFDKLVSVAVNSTKNLQTVTEVTSFEREFQGIGYNRVLGEKGSVDNVVRGMRFMRENESPIILINYGCHPVSMGANREYSADYPGAVVQGLEQLGYDGIFLQGALGDVDPIERGSYEVAQKLGYNLAVEALNGLRQEGETLDDYTIRTVLKTVNVPVQLGEEDRQTMERRLKAVEKLKVDNAERIEQDPVYRYEFTLLYRRYDQGLRELDNGRNLCLQAISIGNVVFVGFPGEVFTDIGGIVRQAFPWETVLILGQANGDAGYITTRDDVEEKRYGGYTCYDFVFNMLPLAPGVGESLARRAVYMVDEMLWPRGE